MNLDDVSPDPWAFLRSHTAARIAQGRTGHSLPTRALLDFQLDHARARDAVFSTLDLARLTAELTAIHPRVQTLHSRAANRREYLQRPDLGRQLALSADFPAHPSVNERAFDVAIVIADGLSAAAVNHHAVPVVSRLAAAIEKIGWSLAPITLIEQGRVAIADEVAYALSAELVVMLIGERPGLSSPDSLGAYLTFRPRPGLTDESRNCVSNIRPEGMPYDVAAQKLLYLLTEMKTRRLSGVGLKDEMEGLPTGESDQTVP